MSGVNVTWVLVPVCVCVLSGSHTHSEPRIVIIFSEFLQTDGQDGRTGWMDRQMCTDRQGERRDQIGDKEDNRKQEPSSHRDNERHRQQAN